MEDGWDGRHIMHFSRNNVLLNPVSRDYFDRPRVEKKDSDPGLRVVPVRATWSLGDLHTYPAAGPLSGDSPTSSSSRQSPYMAPERVKAHAEKKWQKVAEAAWDGRHATMHSTGNELLHDSQKELFGRFVKSRSQVVVPHRVHGITEHYFPHHQYGNENGCDDAPTAAELLLTGLDQVPIPPVPRAGRRLLQQARGVHTHSAPAL